MSAGTSFDGADPVEAGGVAFDDLGEGIVKRAEILVRPEVADASALADADVGEVYADLGFVLRLRAERFVGEHEEFDRAAAVLAVVGEYAARGDGVVAFGAVVDDDGDGVRADAVDAAAVISDG